MKVASINKISNHKIITTPKLKKKSGIMNNQVLKKSVLIPTVAFLTMFATQKINAQTENKKDTTNVETVQYTEDIKLFGKDYTLVYMDGTFSKTIDDKAIADIYFVPKDEKARTLKLEHLFHTKTEEDEIVTALVSDCNNPNLPQQALQEIKLPYELGRTLLDLYQGNSEFFLIPGSHTYTDR